MGFGNKGASEAAAAQEAQAQAEANKLQAEEEEKNKEAQQQALGAIQRQKRGSAAVGGGSTSLLDQLNNTLG